MANEWTLLVETGPQIPFTVANATGISKGAVLKLTDPMTGALSAGAGDLVAGILGSEKIASDGTTEIGVYRDGIWKATLSGSCTVGDPLETSATTNMVKTATLLSGSKVIGIALETGTTGETIKLELRPGYLLGVQ